MDPLLEPLTIRGRGKSATFPVRALLAPMDGVTDAAFRGLVLEMGDVGGAVTEFLRLATGPYGAAAIRRELGKMHPTIPTGLQIMASGPENVGETAATAEANGAGWLDLNFGCPAKRVFNKCAGSALLAEPRKVEEIVRAAVEGTALPVSAKVRAGISDAGRLEEILDAAAAGGAAMVTLHARLRTDSYAAPAKWEWIARAVEWLRARRPGIALVGNGGVGSAAGARRMVAATGCDAVMVGRAAFADPFVFREIRGGPPATAEEAAAFALRYMERLPFPGKAKQLLRYYAAGGLFDGREEERAAMLREGGIEALRRFFERTLAPGTPFATV